MNPLSPQDGSDREAPLDALRRCVTTLKDQGFSVMVVGGFAVMAHGEPRTTRDLDVAVQLGYDDRELLVPVLEDLGTGPPEERRDPQWGRRLVTYLDNGLMLEVFFLPAHPLYDREFARRQIIDVAGDGIPFMSPEDLILRKLVNTKLRKKHDLDDAIGVARVQGEGLDLEYLREHCEVQRVCGRLEEVLSVAGLV